MKALTIKQFGAMLWLSLFQAAFAAQAQPANDDFAQRIKVTGTEVILEGSNTGATLESGEPQPSWLNYTNTVWWEWTAPTSGTVVIQPEGGDFSPVVAVYEGGSLPTLVLVTAQSFFYYYHSQPELAFAASEGTTYSIAVGGLVGATPMMGTTGKIQVGLYEFPPAPNDAFAASINLGRGTVQTNGWNINATTEPEEPDGLGHSVWYSWQATTSGSVTVSFAGSGPLLGKQDYERFTVEVFRGDSLPHLEQVRANYACRTGDGMTSQFAFEAAARSTYRLKVDGLIGFGKFSLVVAETEPPDVFLDKPEPGSTFRSSEPILLSAQVFVPVGHADHVDFYADEYLLLGTVSNWPYAMIWTNQTPGQHTISARVTDQFGLYSSSLILPIFLRPANDDFANRITIPSSNYLVTVTGTLEGATHEPGDPTDAGNGGSIWWSWTAPTSGLYTFNGSSDAALYTGGTLAELSLVTNWYGQIVERVEGGVTYQIAQVARDDYWTTFSVAPSAPPEIALAKLAPGGRYTNITSLLVSAEAHSPGESIAKVDFFLDGALVGTVTNVPYEILLQGLVSGSTYSVSAEATDNYGSSALDSALINIFPPRPANDDFANRTALAGLPLLVTGTTAGATAEPGQPSLAESSVWYSWTPSHSGPCTIIVAEDWYDASVVVYVGSSLSSLVKIASSSFDWAIGERVVFDAVEGTSYQIAYATDPWATGPFALSLVPFRPPFVSITSPINGASFQSGSSPILISADATSSDASIVRVEFYLGGNLVGSVSNQPYNLSLKLDNLYTEIYTVQARAIDSHDLTNLSSEISFTVNPPNPANDNFSNRLVLTGSSLVTTGSLRGATVEPGEQSPGEVSVWWSWTAPVSGIFTIRSASPWDRHYSALSIYTGSDLTTLARVPGSSTQNGLVTNQVVLRAQSGVTYQLAISSNDSGDDVTLAIEPSGPPLLRLTSPADGATIPWGAPIQLRAEASDDSGSVSVDFFLDGQLMVSFSKPPFATNITLGEMYSGMRTLSASATDTNGLVTWEEISFWTGPSPPLNDRFADRIQISGFLVMCVGTTSGATTEPGEQGLGSVWWSWVAPASGNVRLQSDVPAQFVVYTGNGPAVTNLVMIANEHSDQLVFRAVAGVTYQISVVDSGNGDFRFSLFLDTSQITQLTTAEPDANGGFRLLLSTLAERDWILEGSKDLMEWSALATNTSHHHVIEFVDATATNSPAKFYRVVPGDSLLQAAGTR
jgi:hypothetical protein